MPSVEAAHKTDKGYGMRRVVDLSRSIVFTSDDMETISTFELWERLYRAFHRKYLYDWYSRNHKRYSWGETFIELTIEREESITEITVWSKTHGVSDEAARPFFEGATRELAQKLHAKARRGGSWHGTIRIQTLGVAVWRSKKK